MSRKNRNYSIEIKLKSVKMYLEEGLSSSQIAKSLDLNSKNRVLLCSKRYEEFGIDGLKERRGSIKSPLSVRTNRNFKQYRRKNGKDKFLIIKELSCKYTVKLFCNIAAVSRSGYYKWINKGNKDISYSELENKIIEIYNKSKKSIRIQTY